MEMILLISHKEDFTTDFVVNKLNHLSVPYYRLNCEDILIKNNVSIVYDGAYKAVINGISKFNSVWFRRVKFPIFEVDKKAYEEFCLSEMGSYYSNLWCSINAEKWLSKPECIYRAENKVLQLNIAKLIGFSVPETLISSNFEEIVGFYNSSKKNIIIKPLYKSRVVENDKQSLIFTNRISQHHIELLESSLKLPSIYQRHIKKKREYRVTVVNNDVFSAYVDSQSDEETTVDWRKKKLKFHKAALPRTVEKMCIELTKSLGLSFGAIDLIESTSGEYFFLEINPNGQWAWIEIDTGLEISKSIISFLNT